MPKDMDNATFFAVLQTQAQLAKQINEGAKQ